MNYVGRGFTGTHVDNEEDGNVTWDNNFSHFQGMIFDVAGHEFEMYYEPSKKVSNSDDERF